MFKIIVPFPKDENINYYLEKVDGFILGLEEFSENFNRYVKINDLKKYCNLVTSKNKSMFIALNKQYFNNEIKKLKEILFLLNELNISGVMFIDLSVLNIINENNLSINPIWFSNHSSTNSYTINFLTNRNVKGTLLSDEITIEERLKIMDKINIDVFITLFGYINIATSSRTLLSNYFKYINKNKALNNNYYIKEKNSDDFYPIVENSNTNFFSHKILNGIKEFKKILAKKNNGYIVLNDYMIDSNLFYTVIESFNLVKENPTDNKLIEELYKKIDDISNNNTYDGFLNKKTIFRVKRL